MPGPLDRHGKGSLVGSTRSGLPSGLHPRPVRDVTPEPGDILVIYAGHVVHTEGAHLAPREKPWPAAPSHWTLPVPTSHLSVSPLESCP